ncbi:MAG: hypothetical protein AAF682_06775 [Planctomycetota bacterium]
MTPLSVSLALVLPLSLPAAGPVDPAGDKDCPNCSAAEPCPTYRAQLEERVPELRILMESGTPQQRIVALDEAAELHRHHQNGPIDEVLSLLSLGLTAPLSSGAAASARGQFERAQALMQDALNKASDDGASAPAFDKLAGILGMDAAVTDDAIALEVLREARAGRSVRIHAAELMADVARERGMVREFSDALVDTLYRLKLIGKEFDKRSLEAGIRVPRGADKDSFRVLFRDELLADRKRMIEIRKDLATADLLSSLRFDFTPPPIPPLAPIPGSKDYKKQKKQYDHDKKKYDKAWNKWKRQQEEKKAKPEPSAEMRKLERELDTLTRRIDLVTRLTIDASETLEAIELIPVLVEALGESTEERSAETLAYFLQRASLQVPSHTLGAAEALLDRGSRKYVPPVLDALDVADDERLPRETLGGLNLAVIPDDAWPEVLNAHLEGFAQENGLEVFPALGPGAGAARGMWLKRNARLLP